MMLIIIIITILFIIITLTHILCAAKEQRFTGGAEVGHAAQCPCVREMVNVRPMRCAEDVRRQIRWSALRQSDHDDDRTHTYTHTQTHQ